MRLHMLGNIKLSHLIGLLFTVLMASTSQQLPRILYVILPSILPNHGYTVTILPPGVHSSWGEQALPGHRAISVLVSIRLEL